MNIKMLNELYLGNVPIKRRFNDICNDYTFDKGLITKKRKLKSNNSISKEDSLTNDWDLNELSLRSTQRSSRRSENQLKTIKE